MAAASQNPFVAPAPPSLPTSIHTMQTPEPVACHEAAVGQDGQAKDRRVSLQAGGLDAGFDIAQPDGAVIGARRELSIRQRAQGGGRIRVPSRRAVWAPVLTSHNRMVWSREPDASRPSGSMHSVMTKFECPPRRAVSAPLLMSHRRMRSYEEPEASHPSGSAHSVLTPSQCPLRRAVSAPAVTSHSRMVLSPGPEASRPSGSMHSAATELDPVHPTIQAHVSKGHAVTRITRAGEP
jgi:hypothetical protein